VQLQPTTSQGQRRHSGARRPRRIVRQRIQPDFELPAYQDPQQNNYETRGPVQTLGGDEAPKVKGYTHAEWLADVKKQLARANQRLDWLASDISTKARVSSMLDNLNFAFLYAEIAVRESGYAGQAAVTADEKQAVIDTLVGGLVGYFDRLPELVGHVAAAAEREGQAFGEYLVRRNSLAEWWSQFTKAAKAKLPDVSIGVGAGIGAGAVLLAGLAALAFALRK
jgi:hypothetical protein